MHFSTSFSFSFYVDIIFVQLNNFGKFNWGTLLIPWKILHNMICRKHFHYKNGNLLTFNLLGLYIECIVKPLCNCMWMIIIDNTAANTFGLTKLTTNIQIFPKMNKWYILVNKFCIYNLKITYLFWVIGLYQLAICLAAPIMHAVEVFWMPM